METAVDFVSFSPEVAALDGNLIRTINNACGTPQDALHCVRLLSAGHAELWAVQINGVTHAHAITTVLVDALTGSRRYHFWKLHGMDFAEFMRIGLEKTRSEAKRHNCATITFSGRKGWQKILPVAHVTTHYEVNV